MLFQLPSRSGRSRHGAPVLRTHIIASSIGRCAFHFPPRPCLGSSGSINAHWESLNSCRRILRPPSSMKAASSHARSESASRTCAIPAPYRFIRQTQPSGVGMVRWLGGVPQDLGLQNIEPIAISDDGAIIAAQPNSITPYVWTERDGYTPAATYFQSRGVVLPPGLTLYYMTAMSPDGRTFACTANLNGVDGALDRSTPLRQRR